MKNPYDDDIAAMERQVNIPFSIHQEYALLTLKAKRQGWLDAHEKLLPLLRGMQEMLREYGTKEVLEYALSDEQIAILKQVEEEVK